MIVEELMERPPMLVEEVRPEVRAEVLSRTDESDIVGGVAEPTIKIEPFFIEAKVMASMFVSSIFNSFKSSTTI